MKRIVGTFMLLASLGGCVQNGQTPAKSQNPFNAATRPQAKKASPYQGPYGEPIAPGNNPTQGMSPGMPQGGYASGNNPKPGADLTQIGYLEPAGDCANCAPGQGAPVQGAVGGARQVSGHHEHDRGPGLPFYQNKGGIVPVPAQGVPGAVAAIGALPYQMPRQPMNMRTSVNFASPDGMRVTWYGPGGWNAQPLVTPARYNFLQGGVYRMRLSSVANRLEKVYYPTLEVIPAQETTATYLAHSSVPVTFTDEDFEQVDSGNFLVKVVYLPNPNNQDLATVAGPNELVSTRLEPGIDPIVEAQRRGTILMIVRLGNIDLAAPNSPAMDAPNPFMMQRMAPPMGPAMMPQIPDNVEIIPNKKKLEALPEIKRVEPAPSKKAEALPETKKVETIPPPMLKTPEPDIKRPTELPQLDTTSEKPLLEITNEKPTEAESLPVAPEVKKPTPAAPKKVFPRPILP